MAQPKPSHDPTIYPVDDEMGEDLLQRWIAELLRPLLERFLREKGVLALVGADQFIYWQQYRPTTRIAPDVYVLPGIDPGTRVSSWKTWEHGGLAPSFALEIASRDWQKDYLDNPPLYEELGVRELVVYDPDASSSRERVKFQVFRRLKSGKLARVEVTNGDRVRCKTLGCFLREVDEGAWVRLRVGAGARGDELFATDAEARDAWAAEQAAKVAALALAEAERAATAQALATAEAERAAKEEALAKVQALSARLRRLEGKKRR